MRALAGKVWRATPELVKHVVDRARDADRIEFHHAAQRPIADVVDEMLGECQGYVAAVDDEPVAVYGVISRRLLSQSAQPWLIASREVERPNVRRMFLRHGRDELARISANYSYLWGAVHDENAVAIRWLKFMGFRMVDRIGVNGAGFFRFERSQ